MDNTQYLDRQLRAATGHLVWLQCRECNEMFIHRYGRYDTRNVNKTELDNLCYRCTQDLKTKDRGK